jgi:hypothetical protein
LFGFPLPELERIVTEEQWRAAWILCETAGDLDSEAQREHVRGATVDFEVKRHVIAIFEALEANRIMRLRRIAAAAIPSDVTR